MQIRCTQKDFGKILKNSIEEVIMMCIFKAIRCCYLLYLRNFEIRVLKYIWAWSCKVSLNSWISMVSSFKKTKVKLDLLTDIDRVLMVEKGITEGIYHSICRFVKANNKYMKVYDKNKESSYVFNIGM